LATTPAQLTSNTETGTQAHGFTLPLSIRRHLLMAQFKSNTEQLLTAEDQIKALGTKELLDFWEETQQLLSMEEQGDKHPSNIEYDPEYERMILKELQLRSCSGRL
jgi:hypothetical protein